MRLSGKVVYKFGFTERSNYLNTLEKKKEGKCWPKDCFYDAPPSEGKGP